MNLYLYIPYLSFHTDAAKALLHSDGADALHSEQQRQDEYAELKKIFYQRLRDRGYPPHSCCRYSIRSSMLTADFFLWPASTLHLHPDIITRPPLSACLQRRMQRWTASQRPSDSAAAIQSPPVFVIPYSPLSAVLPTRQLLMRAWDMMQDAMGQPIPGPIIAYQSSSSLLKTLVYSRARQIGDRIQTDADCADCSYEQTQLKLILCEGDQRPLSAPSPQSL